MTYPCITFPCSALALCGDTETGRNDVAASVLGCAAAVRTHRGTQQGRRFVGAESTDLGFQFEEQLRNVEDDSNGAHDQAKARAVVLYFCSRMLTVRPSTLEVFVVRGLYGAYHATPHIPRHGKTETLPSLNSCWRRSLVRIHGP